MKFTRHKSFFNESYNYYEYGFLINNSKIYRAYYTESREVKNFLHQFSVCTFDGESEESNNIKQEAYCIDNSIKKYFHGGSKNHLLEGIVVVSEQPITTITNTTLREFMNLCYCNNINY